MRKMNREYSLTWPASMLIYTNKRKLTFYMRKEFNSHKVVLVHQHGIVLEHQYGRLDVMCLRSIRHWKWAILGATRVIRGTELVAIFKRLIASQSLRGLLIWTGTMKTFRWWTSRTTLVSYHKIVAEELTFDGKTSSFDVSQKPQCK